MIDIVDRLRAPGGDVVSDSHIIGAARIAADEIEWLRAALRSIANNTCCAGCGEAARVAATALKEGE